MLIGLGGILGLRGEFNKIVERSTGDLFWCLTLRILYNVVLKWQHGLILGTAGLALPDGMQVRFHQSWAIWLL